MARPIKKVDIELIKKLAAINCSMDEIADAVDLNRRTLQRRYAAVIEKGRSNGKISLKRKMYETAMNGNVTMMIWLSKQMLGYRDKIEEKVQATIDTKVVFQTNMGGYVQSSNPNFESLQTTPQANGVSPVQS